MRVLIKKLDGQKEPINVEETDSVGKVKEMLSEKAGVDKAQIRLILRGQPMVDAQTLLDAKVKAGDTIHMILQMRGGSL